MVTDVVMPRYSLTMEKGTVVKWFKKEGDPVKKDEPLVEVEADKLTTEVESPISGILLKICAGEQTEVPCGQPLAYVGNLDEPFPEVKVFREEKAHRKEEVIISAPEEIPETEEEIGEKVLASPLARSLAKQQKVNLSQVRGTGPKGRITREDVLQFIELRKDVRTVKEVLPLRGIQKTIAERMFQSLRTTAQCSLSIEVDALRIITLRQKNNENLKTEGKNGISYTDILVKAVATALRANMLLNSTLEDDQIKVFEDVNIGIAVKAEVEGQSCLFVPVVHNADQKSLVKIAKESKGLIEKVRSGKASREDLTGGTFTLTNLGMYGIETFIPIINPPEMAILGVGAIHDKPIIVQGSIKVQPFMHLTLSFDHRVINGATAARFMQQLKQILEEQIE